MEENEKEKIEIEKSRKPLIAKIITGGLVLGSIIWMIAQKQLKPELSLAIPFWIFVALLGAFLFTLLWKQIINVLSKKKEDQKLIEPMTQKEVDERVKKIALEFSEPRYIIGKPEMQITHNRMGNIIYERHERLHWYITLKGKKTDKVIMLINATNKHLEATILPPETSREEIEIFVDKLAGIYQKPDTERITREIDRFGSGRETIEKTHEKKEEKAVV